MLRSLLAVGEAEGLSHTFADILLESRAMQHLCQWLGFRLARSLDGGRATYEIAAPH